MAIDTPRKYLTVTTAFLIVSGIVFTVVGNEFFYPNRLIADATPENTTIVRGNLSRGTTSIPIITIPMDILRMIPVQNPCLQVTTVPQDCHTLQISFVGTGKGSVSLDGKNCRSDSGTQCITPYQNGKDIRITATPDADAIIGEWGGDCTQPPVGGGIDPTYMPPPLNINTKLDRDKTCVVTFIEKPKLTIQFEGQGFGMVRDIAGQINCATGNIGKCTFAVDPLSGTGVKLNYLAAPLSVFGGSGGDCADINQPIIIDRTKTCIVTFNLRPGVTLPQNIVHSISPEAVKALNDIYTRNYVFLGWPTSQDMQIPGYSHFQVFRTHGEYRNSIEITSEPDGSFCAYAAYTPDKSPYWYDTFDAVEQAGDPSEGEKGRFDFTAHREWANDRRTLGQVWDSNWNPSTWVSTSPPFGEFGNPFPPGRGPPPQWIKTCANSYGNFPAEVPPSPLIDAAKYCNYTVAAWYGAHLQWCRIDPPLDFRNLNALNSRHQPWVSHTATGIITQGVRAGDDFGSSHGDPGDLAPNYWLGVMLPGQQRPFWDSPYGCGTFHAEHDLCSDWQNGIWPDPRSRGLVSASPRAGYPPEEISVQKNVWTEIEQWLVPQGYRGDPGDRTIVVGRWITDGGHDDFHTELHPIEAQASTFLQTGPLQRYEPPESFNPPVPSDTVNDLPTIFSTDRLTMINLPFISDRWSELTHGNPAAVTKFVVTSTWQGRGLTFDIYPPPRPSPEAQLHWAKEDGIIEGEGVDVLYSLEPPDNPNHLVITIPDTSLPPLSINPEYGQVFPDPNRRIVNAYMLWWENQ